MRITYYYYYYYYYYFYLAVNKRMAHNTQNIFNLIAKNFGFERYTLSKLDKIIQINGIIFHVIQREI